MKIIAALLVAAIASTSITAALETEAKGPTAAEPYLDDDFGMPSPRPEFIAACIRGLADEDPAFIRDVGSVRKLCGCTYELVVRSGMKIAPDLMDSTSNVCAAALISRQFTDEQERDFAR